MFSIIIPTREEEKAIGKTLAHLRELSLPHELIVSDGKSKDRTVEVARQFTKKVIVFDGEKHNASIGRNDGARVAQGEFLVFIDADTYIHDPDTFFTRALEHFKDANIVGVTGPQRALPSLETWADRISFGILNFNIKTLNNVFHRGEASGKFMMVRAANFKQVNGFREDLPTREDGDFFCRLSKTGRTLFDSNLMVYHGARRAHKIGWARLWSIWLYNSVHFMLFDKAAHKDWTPVR